LKSANTVRDIVGPAERIDQPQLLDHTGSGREDAVFDDEDVAESD
jgi:hypothetical protein